MFLEYFPGETIIHRLDVRAKLFIFTVFLILLFLYRNPVYNLVFALLSTLFIYHIGLPFGKIFKILKPIFPILIIISLITSFSHSVDDFTLPVARMLIFEYGFIQFTSGGLLYGLTLVLRIYNMVMLSSVLTYSTPLDHFLQLMKRMHLPRGLSFVIITGIRFVPAMQKKVDMVLEAQKARGAKFDEGGLLSRVKAYVPIMVPLLAQSIYMSEKLAVAMLNRGYGAEAERTSLDVIEMKKRDWIAMILFLAILILAVYLNGKGAGIL